MTLAAGILAAVLIVVAYWFGTVRGFTRGYLTSLLDQRLTDEETRKDEAYLTHYGEQINAGREGRN